MGFLINPVRSSDGCKVACGFALFFFFPENSLLLLTRNNMSGVLIRDAVQTCQAKIGRAGSGEGGGCASSFPSPRVFFASVLTISAHYFLGAWNRLL